MQAKNADPSLPFLSSLSNAILGRVPPSWPPPLRGQKLLSATCLPYLQAFSPISSLFTHPLPPPRSFNLRIAGEVILIIPLMCLYERQQHVCASRIVGETICRKEIWQWCNNHCSLICKCGGPGRYVRCWIVRFHSQHPGFRCRGSFQSHCPSLGIPVYPESSLDPEICRSINPLELHIRFGYIY